MTCMNRVPQYIERGFHIKEVMSRCGQTSQYGTTLLCEECLDKAERDYPQGWRDYPGDTCPHGNYVGGNGADYICGECE